MRNAFELLVLLAVLVIFVAAIWGRVDDEARWEEFSRLHSCKVIAKKAEQILYGSQTVVAPARTVYQCDDGAVYER